MNLLAGDNVEHDILDLLAGSILWRAMTHHDLVIAILKAWPTFQVLPRAEPLFTTGVPPAQQRTLQQIWQLPRHGMHDRERMHTSWLGEYEGSADIATRAVLFHLRHSRHALAQLVPIATVCRRWYAICQTWIPAPTLHMEPRIFPLQLGLSRSTHRFQADKFLSLPVDPYLHHTDFYLFQMALAALERVQGSFGRMDPVDDNIFPLYTLNYYKSPAGGARWVHYVLVYTPAQLRKALGSVHWIWFAQSYPIERLAAGQILPRHMNETFS